MLAGRPEVAEARLRGGYERLEEMGERAVLATTAALLARAIEAQGRDEEADHYCRVSRETAAAGGPPDPDHVARDGRPRPRPARADGERGRRPSPAPPSSSPRGPTCSRSERTRSSTWRRCSTWPGSAEEADAAISRAIELLERKGCPAAAERARSRRAEIMPETSSPRTEVTDAAGAVHRGGPHRRSTLVTSGKAQIDPHGGHRGRRHPLRARAGGDDGARDHGDHRRSIGATRVSADGITAGPALVAGVTIVYRSGIATRLRDLHLVAGDRGDESGSRIAPAASRGIPGGSPPSRSPAPRSAGGRRWSSRWCPCRRRRCPAGRSGRPRRRCSTGGRRRC